MDQAQFEALLEAQRAAQERHTALIVEAQQNQSGIMNEIAEHYRRIKEESRDATEASDSFNDSIDGVLKRYPDLQRFDNGWIRMRASLKAGRMEVELLSNMFGRDLPAALDKAEKKQKALLHELNRQGKTARGGLGIVGGSAGLGLSGPRGVLGAVQGVAGQIMGQLPMGGLLGLMLFGLMRDAEFAAATRRATRPLDAVFMTAKQGAKDAGASIRALYRATGGGMGELVAPIITQMASQIRDTSMGEVIGRRIGGFGNTTAGYVGAMEQTLGAGAGQIAGLINQIATSGAGTFKEITKDFVSLGDAARVTETNAVALMTTLTQAASALRTQRVGVADLRDTYLQLATAYAESGRYATKGAAGAAAMEDVSAVAQGIAGLSVGLKAEIGRRVTGNKKEGLDAYVAFEEGMLKGAGSSQFSAVVGQLKTLSKEFSGNRSEQIYGLQSQGFSFGAARAIVDSDGSEKSLKKIEAEMKKGDTFQKQLMGALDRVSSTVSNFSKFMLQTMDDLAALGSSLFVLLSKAIAGIFQIIPAMMEGDTAKVYSISNGVMAAQDKVVDNFTSTLEKLAGRIDSMSGDTTALRDMITFMQDLFKEEPAPPPTPEGEAAAWVADKALSAGTLVVPGAQLSYLAFGKYIVDAIREGISSMTIVVKPHRAGAGS